MRFQRNKFIHVLAISLSLLFLYFNISVSLPDNIIAAIHFAGFGILLLLMYPLGRPETAAAPYFEQSPLAFLIDALLILGLLLSVLYLYLYEDSIANRNYDLNQTDYLVGFMTIALGLELVRRSMGWIIPCIIIIGVSYVLWWGQYLGGIFNFPGISSEYFLVNNYFGDNEDGLYGTLANISWTMVFIFILFGAFLVESGAGDFIIRLSDAAVGRFTGGPGLVAVLGSGLMGSVSGSAIANTTATGVITIPMMIKAGFPPKFAAAVEAGASTGGQLIPPIMGAGVFIMVSYTQISFLEIIRVAAIPGLLYFVSIAFYVRVVAKKNNLINNHALNKTRQSGWQIFKQGWHHLLPMALLVYMLVKGFTPTYAGGYAIISVILFSWVGKFIDYFQQNKPASPKLGLRSFLRQHPGMGFKNISQALSEGGKSCATIAVLLVTISLFVNAINISGLSITFSQMITEWSGGNLLLMIFLVALASLVIGMGLPVTASYIVLATLCAPALYNLIAQQGLQDLILSGQIPETAKQIVSLLQPEFSAVLNAPASSLIPDQVQSLLQTMPIETQNLLLENSMSPYALSMLLLAAHMIIFWLSQDSNVTPPVCLVAYAAAAIAKTPPMATGIEAWKTAKALYVIPILFAYTPFLSGSLWEVLAVFLFAGMGMYALVGTLHGHLEKALSIPMRIAFMFVGFALIWPSLTYLEHSIVMIFFIGLFMLHLRWPINAQAKTQDEITRNT